MKVYILWKVSFDEEAPEVVKIFKNADNAHKTSDICNAMEANVMYGNVYVVEEYEVIE